jgi:hypothetical protein
VNRRQRRYVEERQCQRQLKAAEKEQRAEERQLKATEKKERGQKNGSWKSRRAEEAGSKGGPPAGEGSAQ